MTKKTRAKARRALLTLSLVLVMMMVAVGGTIAWLTDYSEEVVNTFTSSKVEVELTETQDGIEDTVEHDFPMVPGNTIDKDPKVNLTAESEDAYIFVKVVKSSEPAAFDDYLSYTPAEGWVLLQGENTNELWYGYETVMTKSAPPVSFLANDKVTVKTSVTTDLMTAITGDSAAKPTMTLTAYAVQSANLTDSNSDSVVDIYDAWAAYNDPTASTNP